MRLKGVFVATATLFDKEGNLALTRIREHLEWLAKSGVDGIVPCATTGEGPALTREERRAQIEIAREIASRHGLKVIAGCGGNNSAAVVELVGEAESLGCDAALVVTPYYNKPTQSGLVAHYEFVADRTALPIVLYNVPSRTGVHLELDTALRLFAHKRIVGIKEASGQHSHWLALASQMDLASKNLLAGDDDAFATIGALGGSGIISASANVAPVLFVELSRAIEAGDFPRAFSIQKRLNPLIRALFMETSPSPIKYALHRLKGYENVVRLPLVPVKNATETTLLEVLKKLELWGGT